MTVRKSDVILLEAYLKRVARQMNPQLHWLQGQHNTAYEQPIQVKFGSNSFMCDAEELEPLIEAMEDEHCSPNQFYREAFEKFLRECADR